MLDIPSLLVIGLLAGILLLSFRSGRRPSLQEEGRDWLWWTALDRREKLRYLRGRENAKKRIFPNPA